jgi:hypothetical protein
MDTLKFGLFDVDDPIDERFACDICWSRVYEYPFVLNHVKGPAVHNTAWGFEGIHLVFKAHLDAVYPGTVHSDLRASDLPGTAVWDLRTPPPDGWVNRFDTVLCISTLEHIGGDHTQIIRDNLLPQVRAGGELVVTFDLPGLQLDAVETYTDRRLERPARPLTPKTSRFPDRVTGYVPGDLQVGYLIIRKTRPPLEGAADMGTLEQAVLNLTLRFTAEGVRREDGKTAAEVEEELDALLEEETHAAE